MTTLKEASSALVKAAKDPVAAARKVAARSRAGQKRELHNERLPRVINISFQEKTCMFACKMCPYAEDDVRNLYRKSSEGMSFETLQNIVASVPDDPRYTFDISNIGETLVFKPLADFITYMKRERPRVTTVVSTNALLLSEEVFAALVRSGLDHLQLSLYAENAHDHSLITGTTSFQRCAENIRKAWAARQRLASATPKMKVFMMGTREHEARFAPFVEEWRKYSDEAFIRPVYNLARTIEGMTPLHPAATPDKRYPCIIPWYSTSIRSDGDVLGCYIFNWDAVSKDIVVGNINQATLEEIWASQRMKDFRDKHLRLDFQGLDACKSCDLWSAYPDVWTHGPEGFTFEVAPTDYVTLRRKFRGG